MISIGKKIVQMRRAKLWDQKELAEQLGVSQASVSRWESDKQVPGGRWLSRLAQLFDVTVDTFLNTSPGNNIALQEVSVMGAVEAGAFVESLEWDQETQGYSIAVPPDSRYPGIPRFGLRVCGPSMNKLYPDGAVIICLLFADLERGPFPGERVVICRRNDTGMIEATCKEIRVGDGGEVWAWPMSEHPAHQSPIKLENNGHDDDPDVWPHALIVGSFRFE